MPVPRIDLEEMSQTAFFGVRDSIDPTTGNQLHVNKRPYDEWEQLIRGILEPEWTVERVAGKRYVSETWRAWR